MSLASDLKQAVTPRAALLVVGCLALQLLFITSYVGALHHPKPKDVPFGVVVPAQAPPETGDQLVTQLNKLSGDPLDAREVSSEAEARKQIMDRKIDGALLFDPAGKRDTLLVASGGGAALSHALGTIGEKFGAAQQRTQKTVDVAPASAEDFNGLSAFYLVVGWCVGGYLCASILAISAGSRAATPQRAGIRLGAMAVYSVLGGLGGAVLIGPVLGALPGSVLALSGLGALVVFAVGALTLALQSLTGIVGIGLAVLIVVIGGNPSAGGAIPGPMLPPFWEAIGPALPPGAGTWVARSIAYFEGHGVSGSLQVLAIWAIIGTVVTLVMSSLRRPEVEGTEGPGATQYPQGA
ncbi:DUF3533 domain-containing protein [Streptomyces sp. NPDC004111]|uniref:DUF3533 domain-containing protein n=1 Tax=Streptomyces sp. NPDC004111 TaxID=3364690 RepID=UPI00368CEC18